jgi:hypothetical protein
VKTSSRRSLSRQPIQNRKQVRPKRRL